MFILIFLPWPQLLVLFFGLSLFVLGGWQEVFFVVHFLGPYHIIPADAPLGSLFILFAGAAFFTKLFLVRIVLEPGVPFILFVRWLIDIYVFDATLFRDLNLDIRYTVVLLDNLVESLCLFQAIKFLKHFEVQLYFGSHIKNF